MTRRPTDAPRKPAAPRPAKAAKPEAEAKPGAERIAKVLSRAGIASRRDAEKMILEGRVSVNGKQLDSPALAVTPQDRVTVDGKPLAPPEPPRLWLYHKPDGLVTTARDELGRPTVFDRLPEDLPRVMTVGRLDLNSEGLLLLTNDGELKRRLELPTTGWLRKYRVRVNGRPEDTTFAPLREGIVIEGERFQPMTVSLDRQQGANAWLTIGIREGRNREIRRAMEAVGMAVNRLIRISYGPFQLGDLAPGAVEEVRPRLLRDQLGLSETPMPRPAAKGPVIPRPTGAAPSTRGTKAGAKPAGTKPATKGARGLAASATAWAERQAAPRGGDGAKPAAKGGLTRGGARADAAPAGDRPGKAARAGKAPAETGKAPKGPAASRSAPRGPRPGGKPPATPRGGGKRG